MGSDGKGGGMGQGKAGKGMGVDGDGLRECGGIMCVGGWRKKTNPFQRFGHRESRQTDLSLIIPRCA